jgi:hypothetical protein
MTATAGRTIVVETCNLEGPALDWAVATVQGARVQIVDGRRVHHVDSHGHVEGRYQPSMSWNQAGELVDAHIKRMGDCCEPVNGWDAIPEGKQCFAMAHNNEFATGATKRIAVCRAVVLAKLGTSVEVPAVLVSQ